MYGAGDGNLESRETPLKKTVNQPISRISTITNYVSNTFTGYITTGGFTHPPVIINQRRFFEKFEAIALQAINEFLTAFLEILTATK